MECKMNWLVKVVVLELIIAVRVNMCRKNPDKIGVILDKAGKSKRLNTLSFAWSHFKERNGNPNVKFTPAAVIDISNNHELITSLCEKVSNRSIMMIVDYNPASYGSVQSYAHYLNVPTLVPGGVGSSLYDPYRYDMSLLPPTIDAIVAMIKYLEWNKVVYYVFDTNDGMQRLQRLYQSFVWGDPASPLIRARRISNSSDCYEILRKIDRGPLPKRIHVVLDMSSRFAYEEVLHQIVDVGMNRDGYHYLLGGLGINELDLSTFVYGGVNITGFSIVDNGTSDNMELIRKAKTYDIHPISKITVEEALIIDTVHVLMLAIVDLNSANNPDVYNMHSGGGRHSRVGSLENTSCSGEGLPQTFDGEMVLESMKKVKTYGLTGNVEFDKNGIRQNYIFRVYQLEHKKPLREVGVWTPLGGLTNMSLPKPQKKIPDRGFNRTLRVTTIKEEPFVQFKKTTDESGAPMVDGNQLEGYCVDLAVLLQKACDTPYEYYIDLVQDRKYGKLYQDDGCWDGMIGELINTNGCPHGGTRPKADMAIAPLTINEVRQRVVDFTKPFMQTGISIMIKKPDKEKPGVFSFMYPLANTVWVCVMVAFVAVSLVLFFVGRWSPYEWGDQDPKGGVPINNFNILNTFWFSLGALMQQGSDTFPRSYSGRIVGSAWWFFTLILISSYTANLAAFLTIERLMPPINSADDLVKKNGEIEYGTLTGGSSVAFFEETSVPVYKQMGAFMKANAGVMMPDVKAGVERVRNSKGKYAFLLESAYNKYHNQRKPCNTMKIGNNLDRKGYGIATPMNFYLKNPLNLAVLKLREAGELMKLEQKWWYSKGMCGTDKKDATTSALTLSNVSGVFHILVGGLLLAMVVALCEYLIHQHIRNTRQAKSHQKSQAVRIVRKEPLEALKEVGYSDRELTAYGGYSSCSAGAASAPLVTFDSKYNSHHSSPDH